MNRLILIGNGFDLAHGLATDYKSFIEHLKQRIEKKEIENGQFVSIPQNSTLKFQELCTQRDKPFSHIDRDNIAYVSPFLRQLVTKTTLKNWVDIEAEYFDCLVRLHAKKSFSELDRQSLSNEFDDRMRSLKFYSIQDLNSDFDTIKKELIEYLENEEQRFTQANIDDTIAKSFGDENMMTEVVTKDKIGHTNEIQEICFLNFNYTDVAYRYSEYFSSRYTELMKINKRVDIKFIYIHGKLNGDNTEHGAPIFGFGDVFNKDFLDFEKFGGEEFKELNKNMKLFNYSTNYNNFKLRRWLESNPFQVCIYGHSCGLTDRNLLQLIFEHEKCNSIKVFYKDEDDYVSKSHDIARHFIRDKAKFSEKLVPLKDDKGKLLSQSLEIDKDKQISKKTEVMA